MITPVLVIFIVSFILNVGCLLLYVTAKAMENSTWPAFVTALCTDRPALWGLALVWTIWGTTLYLYQGTP